MACQGRSILSNEARIRHCVVPIVPFQTKLKKIKIKKFEKAYTTTQKQKTIDTYSLFKQILCKMTLHSVTQFTQSHPPTRDNFFGFF